MYTPLEVCKRTEYNLRSIVDRLNMLSLKVLSSQVSPKEFKKFVKGIHISINSASLKFDNDFNSYLKG